MSKTTDGLIVLFFFLVFFFFLKLSACFTSLLLISSVPLSEQSVLCRIFISVRLRRIDSLHFLFPLVAGSKKALTKGRRVAPKLPQL